MGLNLWLSFCYPCVVFVADAQATEQGQVLGLALLDLEDYAEEVAKDTQALDCVWGDSSELYRACFSLAQGHKDQGEPLVVGREEA